jgi:hypothetical protein
VLVSATGPIIPQHLFCEGAYRRPLAPAVSATLWGLERTRISIARVRKWQIVLQKSKVAAVQIFGENLKRKEVDDSHSLSRATEVAREFGAR